MGANALALLLTAVANTAANRRLTFGIVGPGSRLRHQAQGLAVFAGGLAATSAALWLFELVVGNGHPGWEILVLTITNLLVTLGRFVVMRTWIFRRSSAAASPSR
jgi:putative flippase GtrA